MKFSILMLGMVLMACGPVGAQIDPDPDGIGIYADLEGTVNHVDAAVDTELSLYILATNITAEGGMWKWQLRVETTSPDIVLLNLEYPYEAIELCGGANVDRMVSFLDNIIPKATIIHMATLNLVVIGTGSADLFLDNSSCHIPDLPPTYATLVSESESRTVFLTPSSGSVEAPVFRINGSAPVTTVNSVWGSVKSLYR